MDVTPTVAPAPEVSSPEVTPTEVNAPEADESGSPEPKEPESKPQPRKLKLKVDGAEEELDESEVISRAQKYSAADKKFQEAAKVRKQAESFIRALRENPKAVLSNPNLGINLREFAEKVLWEDLQEQLVPPEEKERRAEKAELERLREEKRLREETARQQEQEQLKEKYRQDWSKKFNEALEQGGLPRTDWTVKQMAAYMKQALANGHKHIQPADVVELVKSDWVQAQKEMFKHFDAEKLIEVLGADAAEKIRQHDLKKFRSGAPEPRPDNKSESTKKPERTFSSVAEMQSYLAARRR
jgi:hypothetical protein